MRLAVVISALLFISVAVPVTAQESMSVLQQRGGGMEGKFVVPQGLGVTRYATGLGDISAMAIASDGTIFTTDRARGRIYRLRDRDRDGTLDATDVFESGLRNPGGLAIIDDALFVADRQAIWRLPLAGGYRKKLASLARAGGGAGPRPLLPSSTKDGVLIALSGEEGKAKLISVALENGRAELVSTGPGPVTAMAQTDGSDVWLALGRNIIRVTGKLYSADEGFDLSEGTKAAALVLPGQFPEFPDILSPRKDDILVARTGDKPGVIAVSTLFGQPTMDRRDLAGGFKAKHSQTVRGEPGVMVTDRRGLFFADPMNGTVWKLAGAVAVRPSESPDISTKKPVDLPLEETAEPAQNQDL